MGKHNIEKKSSGYNLLYALVKFWHNIIFYRKLTLINKENIPENANIIFTANHQNALMDALALLFTIKRQLVFMARSDIFAKKKIAAILFFLKILPIYRIRDGFESLKKNEEIFAKTIDVFKAGNGLVILPEGSHSGKRRLRQLKKGFARIAFQSEEASDYKLDLKIVPVGLDYSNYEDFRSDLTVNFGEPISVSEYYDIYKENQPVALNQLKDRLFESLSKVMIHITSVQYYNLIDGLRNIYSRKYCQKLGLADYGQPNKFKVDKMLIEKLEKFELDKPKEIKSLDSLVNKYVTGLKNAKITSLLFEDGPRSFISLLLSSIGFLIVSPIYLIGLIFNIIPYQISLASVKIFKDRQFYSSAKLIFSFLIFPIFYLIETLIFSLLSNEGFHWFYFLLGLVISGISALIIHNFMNKLLMGWRLFILKTRKPKVYKLMKTMFDNIISKTDEIVESY